MYPLKHSLQSSIIVKKYIDITVAFKLEVTARHACTLGKTNFSVINTQTFSGYIQVYWSYKYSITGSIRLIMRMTVLLECIMTCLFIRVFVGVR